MKVQVFQGIWEVYLKKQKNTLLAFKGPYGKDMCDKCLQGKFSDMQQVVCGDCAKGSYTDSKGSSVCTKCGGGTYQGATGKSACDRGKWTDPGPKAKIDKIAHN